MISAGMVQTTDMAWHSELPNWLPLHQVLGICPPIPISTEPQVVVLPPPRAGGIGDLLACVLFGVILFLCLLMSATGFALAVTALLNPMGPDIRLVTGPILGIVFLSFGYVVLLAYRNFHRRYIGQLPQDYKGVYGVKLKPSENVSGLLLIGGILSALVSGLHIYVLDVASLILAAILFAFSLDRTKQRKCLKRLRIKNRVSP